MKFNRLLFLALAGMIFSCQQAELLDPTDNGDLKLKTVKISAGMDLPETKASIDSQTGTVAWQEGDVISILATDDKFYDFVLTSGADKNVAEFKGQIPEGKTITKVATHPVLVKNGGRNQILKESTLTYILQTKQTFSKFTSNVPLVATFEDGADYLSFKQVGGVIRFPINNLPANSSVILTTTDTPITGRFTLDVKELGEAAMVSSGTKGSSVTMKYDSDKHALRATVNFPVPTGTFSNFSLTVKDAAGEEIFTKTYIREHTINRGSLYIMNEITLPDLPVEPVSGAEVWPYFVDARVVFPKAEDAEQYAVYIDGATEPVLVDVEDWGDKDAILIGGDFAHNSTHTVEVAKIVNGQPDPATKSQPLTFTTSDVFQLTTNTGTKFVSVGWNDVTIANGPKYANGKWTAVSSALEPEVDAQGRTLNQRRGYRVQLLAADQKTVLCDMIPFAGHTTFQSPFGSSYLLGMVAGEEILTPTALSFSYLEPGKDYYFRVKTLDGEVALDESNGNYIPDTDSSNPYPFMISSERGGCAWSDLVKLSTDPVHVPSANELLYEGFDDIMITHDVANWASGVVPDLDPTARQSYGVYYSNLSKNYPAFLTQSESDRKWTVFDLSKYLISADNLGMFDETYVAEVPNRLNANAGTLEGWSVMTNSTTIIQTLYPFFGAVALGQEYTSHGGSAIITPAINSDQLLPNKGTKCKVRVNASYVAGNKADVANVVNLQIVRNGSAVGSEYGLSIPSYYESEWNSHYTPYHTIDGADAATSNYVHHQRYFTLEYDLYLRKGDSVKIRKLTTKSQFGMLLLGEVTIEVCPGEVEPEVEFEDNGIGTEPDNTDYDVFGLGEFPVSYFYGPPTAFYTKYNEYGQPYYDHEETVKTYQDVKDAGFNIAIYGGEVDYSITENERILKICQDLGLKYVSAMASYPIEHVEMIKNSLYKYDNYLGDYIRDEPPTREFPQLGEYVKEFYKAMPDKEVYINLYPMYANAVQVGSPTYEHHIIDYIDIVNTKSVSFDYYGLKRSHEVKWTYFQNLDLVRMHTLKARKPFWVITQAGPIGTDTLDPTEDEQRWTVWSNIAMGSKGISYFTYYTPPVEAGLGSSEYMLRRDGTKREIYYWIQKLNADIKEVGKKLLPCHADGVVMNVVNYPLWENNQQGRSNYGPVKKVDTYDKAILMGCFRDARASMSGENYKGYKVLVMSKIQNYDVNAKLTIDTSVTEITFTQNSTTETLQMTSGLVTTVGDIKIEYLNGELKLGIPSGEAVLLEF